MMKVWMWLLPSAVLGVLTAALQSGGSSVHKAEFTNKCVGAITADGGTPEVGQKVCSCILDRGLQFKKQNPNGTPSRDDLLVYLKQCSAENGFALGRNRHNPWR